MKRCSVITATSQGVVLFLEKSKNLFIHYEKNPSKSIAQIQNVTNFKAKETQHEKLYLNIIQRQMYRRIMYGLNEFSQEQLASFSSETVQKIEDDYKKGKRIIHVMKAKKLYKQETDLINALFPGFNIGEKEHDWYLEIPKNITLRTLSISTKEVIINFIEKRLLPNNFFEITLENIKL